MTVASRERTVFSSITILDGDCLMSISLTIELMIGCQWEIIWSGTGVESSKSKLSGLLPGRRPTTTRDGRDSRGACYNSRDIL